MDGRTDGRTAVCRRGRRDVMNGTRSAGGRTGKWTRREHPCDVQLSKRTAWNKPDVRLNFNTDLNTQSYSPAGLMESFPLQSCPHL